MEGQKLNLLKRFLSYRKGMALPLTLVILLFGSALVATAFYVVQNMYSTSGHSVTRTELYNAAQSGIEKGRALFAENFESLDVVEKGYDGTLDSIRVTQSGTNLDSTLQNVNVPDLQDVSLTVDILDCNYYLDGVTYTSLGSEQIASLPPSWPGGHGEGTSESEEIPEGTSVIIDPSRFLNFGGEGERRYVLRSRAAEDDGEQSATIEVMVVVK
jgi:hypothetical protein